MVNNELTHWGVRGMRWGVRKERQKEVKLRAQHKKQAEKLEKINKKLGYDTQPNKSEATNKPKSVKDMTDEELNARINRLRLEQTYNQMNPQKVAAGKKAFDSVIAPMLKENGKKALDKVVDAAAKKILGDQKSKSQLLKEDVDMLELQVRRKDNLDKLAGKSATKTKSQKLADEALDWKNRAEMTKNQDEYARRMNRRKEVKEQAKAEEAVKKQAEKEAKERAKAEDAAKKQAEKTAKDNEPERVSGEVVYTKDFSDKQTSYGKSFIFDTDYSEMTVNSLLEDKRRTGLALYRG